MLTEQDVGERGGNRNLQPADFDQQVTSYPLANVFLTPLQLSELSPLDHVNLKVILVDAAIRLFCRLIQNEFHGAAGCSYPYRALFITARTKKRFVCP